jgi:hypothetical protein
MKYEIMNRADASRATHKQDAPPTAIISITDYGDAKNKFHSAQWLLDVLELQFNDEESGNHRCITPEQAQEIAASCATGRG